MSLGSFCWFVCLKTNPQSDCQGCGRCLADMDVLKMCLRLLKSRIVSVLEAPYIFVGVRRGYTVAKTLDKFGLNYALLGSLQARIIKCCH